ncbi:MAG: tetraacyldisaccharide 4'-kinase, partial [Deltaproteobacteria bacterium]|nr:tetraacyldisaccharide 4'-kinase [Deltaproteobacteria bacterium]
IGNLTVGGTGKTPSCVWLARALEKRGLKVGIVTRGYGGKRSAPIVISGNGDGAAPLASAEEVAAGGDEPCMLAKIYGQTVAVGGKRHLAARELLNQQEVDVFILDDGFQHRRVKRDADLVLLGQDTSGWVLPAGPFREPPKAVVRADFLLVTAAEEEWTPLIQSFRRDACFKGTLAPVALVGYQSNQWREYPLSLLYRNKIVAVAGIAHPERFYRMLHEFEGDIVDILEYPDHHDYSPADWQRINRVGRAAELILTTEKDIIKLARFPFAKDKLMALRVQMEVENGDALVTALLDRAYRQHAAGDQN